METTKYNSGMGKFATRLAVCSFVFGTLIFVLWILFPKNENILLLGFLYVAVAATFNGMTVFALVFCCIITGNYRYYLLKIAIIAANIPIVILYINILFYSARTGILL